MKIKIFKILFISYRKWKLYLSQSANLRPNCKLTNSIERAHNAKTPASLMEKVLKRHSNSNQLTEMAKWWLVCRHLHSVDRFGACITTRRSRRYHTRLLAGEYRLVIGRLVGFLRWCFPSRFYNWWDKYWFGYLYFIDS